MDILSGAFGVLSSYFSQKYYLYQQLIKLQIYHHQLKKKNNPKIIQDLLKQYEDAIGYEEYACILNKDKKFYIVKYEKTGDKYLIIGNVQDYELLDSTSDKFITKTVNEENIYKGIFEPLIESYKPEELSIDNGDFVSFLAPQSLIDSYKDLEYIKLKLEAFMEEKNYEKIKC
tara:strand:+ start:2714 stop:3232 length:519 start_codon:yes stop_codon:yes gene_type:complete